MLFGYFFFLILIADLIPLNNKFQNFKILKFQT